MVHDFTTRPLRRVNAGGQLVLGQIEVIEVRVEALSDTPAAIEDECSDETRRSIAVRLEYFGERRLIVADVELSVVADTVEGGKRPGEERGMRRQGERRHRRRLFEAQSVRGQRVYRWRLSRLVADMLVLARADAGGYPLRRVDLYLDDIVAECRRAVEVIAAARGVTVRSGCCPEVAFRGDEDLLRQLVLNVLQNAIQHTPAGGVVTIDLTQNGEAVSIRVVDTGAGIPVADRERIFDRFVQLDAARRGAGTGLGLPIARWIAEAHRGTLVLEDSGPDGSRFCVSLPAAAVVEI